VSVSVSASQNEALNATLARVPDPLLLALALTLLTAAVLELVYNNCTNDDASFDNLLEVGGHVQQVEDVVQHSDDERSNYRSRDCSDSTSRKRSAADDRGCDGIKLVALTKPWLPRTNPGRNHQSA
jgi:hypothetical protein